MVRLPNISLHAQVRRVLAPQASIWRRNRRRARRNRLLRNLGRRRLDRDWAAVAASDRWNGLDAMLSSNIQLASSRSERPAFARLHEHHRECLTRTMRRVIRIREIRGATPSKALRWAGCVHAGSLARCSRRLKAYKQLPRRQATLAVRKVIEPAYARTHILPKPRRQRRFSIRDARFAASQHRAMTSTLGRESRTRANEECRNSRIDAARHGTRGRGAARETRPPDQGAGGSRGHCAATASGGNDHAKPGRARIAPHANDHGSRRRAKHHDDHHDAERIRRNGASTRATGWRR